MYNSTAAPRTGGLTNWLRRTEDWLDSKGKGAWIAAMVLSFVFVWPLGLFFVFYITWTNRWSNTMFAHSCRNRHHDRHQARSEARDQAKAWANAWGNPDRTAFRPSGNATFDNYKADTLKRLEDEQEAFETFLQRLRQAKDKKEFDSFMEDRASRVVEDAPVTDAKPAEAPQQDPRRGEY